MKAIITQGISASGKTTWAREFAKQNNYVIICRDNLRISLYENKYQEPFLWSKWDWKHEKEITQQHQEMIQYCHDNNLNIIIADTNLNPQFLEQLENFLASLGFEIEKKVFHVSFEEACRRDAERHNGVGYSVIAKQYEQYLKLFGEPYQPPLNAPKCIIVDIDGTLANNMGRSPYDWHRVEEDHVHEPIKAIVNNFYNSGHVIIILSGRDSKCREETSRWLATHEISYHHLYMRPENDTRKDTTIKRELFDQHIRDQYNVVLVIDDRPVVCRQWLALGLKTLIAGNPYIEF